MNEQEIKQAIECMFDKTWRIKIGLSKADRLKMANEIYNQIKNELGQTPSGIDTEANILLKTFDDGIWIASDNGYYYFWDAETQAYKKGYAYQGVAVNPEDPIIKELISSKDCVKDLGNYICNNGTIKQSIISDKFKCEVNNITYKSIIGNKSVPQIVEGNFSDGNGIYIKDNNKYKLEYFDLDKFETMEKFHLKAKHTYAVLVNKNFKYPEGDDPLSRDSAPQFRTYDNGEKIYVKASNIYTDEKNVCCKYLIDKELDYALALLLAFQGSVLAEVEKKINYVCVLDLTEINEEQTPINDLFKKFEKDFYFLSTGSIISLKPSNGVICLEGQTAKSILGKLNTPKLISSISGGEYVYPKNDGTFGSGEIYADKTAKIINVKKGYYAFILSKESLTLKNNRAYPQFYGTDAFPSPNNTFQNEKYIISVVEETKDTDGCKISICQSYGSSHTNFTINGFAVLKMDKAKTPKEVYDEYLNIFDELFAGNKAGWENVIYVATKSDYTDQKEIGRYNSVNFPYKYINIDNLKETPYINVVGTSHLKKASISYFSELNLSDAKENSGVVERNKDLKDILKVAVNKNQYIPNIKNFALCMLADLHGDEERLINAIDFTNHYDEIDCISLLGDIVYQDATSPYDWYVPTAQKSAKPFYPAIGNHDGGETHKKDLAISKQEQFNRFFKPILSTIGLSDLNKTYYSKNYDKYKVTYIVLDNYDEPDDLLPNGDFKYSRSQPMFSQTQVDWLIQTLLNVPKDYTILIGMHSLIAHNKIENEKFTDDYFKDFNKELYDDYFFQGINDCIPDIINAWKNGTSLSKPYNFYGVSVNVNVDFATRGKGNFACYLLGHEHKDYAGSLTKYPNQKLIAIALARYISLGSSCDLVRTPLTKYEDVFNIISLDTERKYINVVRVGCNVNRHLRKRDFTSIKYE